MSSIWGQNLKISLFGESHGNAIGCVLDGLPPGIKLDLDLIRKDMKRRSASNYELATPRKEKDEFQILSGFFNGYTTGTPLCAIIVNKNTKSKDYEQFLLRPGHADYTAFKKYKGFQDYRGGGHFSGRLTAPLVLSGSICKQVVHLLEPNIKFGSRIFSLGSTKDKTIDNWKDYLCLDLSDKHIPFLNQDLVEIAEEEIKEAIRNEDSLGGVIEAWITGLPAGLGDPFFGSVESRLSSLLFSVPAVKGVEFGLGFSYSQMKGSEVNDPFIIEKDSIITLTNNNGGLNGGITNGMPIVFRCVIKPTASIKKEQNTVNYKTKEETKIKIQGRHDPSIVLRAPVVIEAASELMVLDLLLEK